jgi:hypothetical protein
LTILVYYKYKQVLSFDVNPGCTGIMLTVDPTTAFILSVVEGFRAPLLTVDCFPAKTQINHWLI